MDVQPCPLCGYDAATLPCAHCRLETTEPSLDGDRPGSFGGVVAGLSAVPRGLLFLARTRGVKRFLIPPFVLTAALFAFLFGWALGWVGELLEAAEMQDVDRLGLEEGWLLTIVEWLVEKSFVLWMAQLSGVLVVLILSSLIAMWTFSIVYEALAGPFLDEIQGRFEKRWFGTDPRNAIERPTDVPVRRCALLSSLAGLAAVALLAWWWFLDGALAWFVLASVPLPFILLGLVDLEYGKWLVWVAQVEGRTLFVSVKAALFAGILLAICFPLRFIPFGIGYVLFGSIAGFTTALSLLDIPFSRRQWSFQHRVRFLRTHALPNIAFGAVASVLFMIPFVGPVLMVPAASIGGVWLLCRLDKRNLRPAEPGVASSARR